MTASMMLVLLACISLQVRAIPCSGAEQLMASIWNELSAGKVSGAEEMLREMERTHLECPEVLLAHAQVAAANGAPAEAEDFFVRYANLAPNEAKAYSRAIPASRFPFGAGTGKRPERCRSACGAGRDPGHERPD